MFAIHSEWCRRKEGKLICDVIFAYVHVCPDCIQERQAPSFAYGSKSLHKLNKEHLREFAGGQTKKYILQYLETITYLVVL